MNSLFPTEDYNEFSVNDPCSWKGLKISYQGMNFSGLSHFYLNSTNNCKDRTLKFL